MYGPENSMHLDLHGFFSPAIHGFVAPLDPQQPFFCQVADPLSTLWPKSEGNNRNNSQKTGDFRRNMLILPTNIVVGIEWGYGGTEQLD